MIRFLTLCALTSLLAMPSHSSDDKGKEELYPDSYFPNKAGQLKLDTEAPEENTHLQSVIDRVVQPVANALLRFQQLSTAGAPLDVDYLQVAITREESSSEAAPSRLQDLFNSLRVELLQSVSSELIGILRQELQVTLSKELAVYPAAGHSQPLLTTVQAAEALLKEKDETPAMIGVTAEIATPSSYAELLGMEVVSPRLEQIPTSPKKELIGADLTSLTAKEIRKKFLQSTVHPECRHLISPRAFKELFGLEHPELEADFITEHGSYEGLLISGRFSGILDLSYIATKKNLRDLKINTKHSLDKGLDIKCSIVPYSILHLDDQLRYYVSNGMQCSGYGAYSCQTYIDRFRKLSISFSNKPLAIPPHMASMNNLKNLCLARNHLNRVPHVIYKMTQLEMLDLSDNELTTISSDISDLYRLEDLNLSNNKLESIPASLSQCSKLIVYKLNLKGNAKLKEIWDRDVARFESIHGMLSRSIYDSKPPLPYESEEPIAILLRSMPGFYQPDVNVLI